MDGGLSGPPTGTGTGSPWPTDPSGRPTGGPPRGDGFPRVGSARETQHRARDLRRCENPGSRAPDRTRPGGTAPRRDRSSGQATEGRRARPWPDQVEVVVSRGRIGRHDFDVVTEPAQAAHLLQCVRADAVVPGRVRTHHQDALGCLPFQSLTACSQPFLERRFHAIERDRPGVVVEHVVAAGCGRGRRIGRLGHEAQALLQLAVVLVDAGRRRRSMCQRTTFTGPLAMTGVPAATPP